MNLITNEITINDLFSLVEEIWEKENNTNPEKTNSY